MSAQIRVRRYKYGYSPCYMSESIDRAVHRTLPGLLRAYADKLERTSPRWGWRAQRAHAAQKGN